MEAAAITPAQRRAIDNVSDLIPSGVVEIDHPPDTDGIVKLRCGSGRRRWHIWITPDGRHYPIEPRFAGWQARS